MKKSIFAGLLISLLLWFSTSYALAPVIDGSFNEAYPTPFFETVGGKIATAAITAVGVAALVAVPLVGLSGGAILGGAAGTTGLGSWSAGWVTFVGSQVGMAAGVGTGSTAAGLAILGGGTIASGGFGMAGGVFVVAALTGVGTGVTGLIVEEAATAAADRIRPQHEKYEMLKVALIEKGSLNVVDIIKDIQDIDIAFLKEKISKEDYQSKMEAAASRLQSELKFADTNVLTDASEETLYNLINRGIMSFNQGRYTVARRDFEQALAFSETGSFLHYLFALSALTDGDYAGANAALRVAIKREPDAAKPYILAILSLSDQRKFKEALGFARKGLNNAGKNFELLRLAGDLSMQRKQYSQAGNYYVKAFKRVSDDYIESETAFLSAQAYRLAGRDNKAQDWYMKAVKKSEKLPDYQKHIQETWVKTTS